jgi:hypothetical protein
VALFKLHKEKIGPRTLAMSSICTKQCHCRTPRLTQHCWKLSHNVRGHRIGDRRSSPMTDAKTRSSLGMRGAPELTQRRLLWICRSWLPSTDTYSSSAFSDRGAPHSPPHEQGLIGPQHRKLSVQGNLPCRSKSDDRVDEWRVEDDTKEQTFMAALSLIGC